MATEKEQVILEFKVDQGAALKDLEHVTKAILNNKDAQKELNDAYKKGAITQDEYVKENIRLQQNLKVEQDTRKTLSKAIDTESNSRNALKLKAAALAKEYDNTNLKTAEGVKRSKELEKQLSLLNAEITRSSKAAGLFKDQIGNYPEKFAEAAKEIEIAGVSVGGITDKLAAFINPATAAAATVALLGAAYERSALGAEDFETASNSLKAALDVFANEIGNKTNGNIFTNTIELASEAASDLETRLKLLFIESRKFDENGKEIINEQRAAAVKAGDQQKENIKAAQYYLKYLRENELTRLEIEGKAKELQREAIILQQKRDDVSKTFNERLEAANQISEHFGDISKENIDNLKLEVRLFTQYGEATGAIVNGVNNDRALKIQILNLQNQIKAAAEEEAQSNRRNERALISITNEKRKQADADKLKLAVFNAEAKDFVNKQDFAAEDRLNATPDFADSRPDTHQIADELQAQKDFNSSLKEVITEREYIYIEDAKALAKAEKQKQEAQAQSLHAAGNIATALSGLAQKGSDEQKALAIAGIGINTAAALAGGISESQDLPYPANLAAMGSTIAAILAAIAQAKAIAGFAEGGWTGPGERNKPAGIVHADEYVTPKHIYNNPAARPHIAALERMRTSGYMDGGLVTGSLTSATNSDIMQANAIKNLPASYVSWKEWSLTNDRVVFKQNTSTL